MEKGKNVGFVVKIITQKIKIKNWLQLLALCNTKKQEDKTHLAYFVCNKEWKAVAEVEEFKGTRHDPPKLIELFICKENHGSSL